MIEHLHLKRFGRFTDRAFPFAPSVVFHGPNESGKTTIFDALFTTLCKVPKVGAYKTDIYQRYGDAMEADLAPASIEGMFEPGEFRDLHAIRSGDVTLQFGDNDSWAATVKSALFSGGIDPAAIAEDLALLSSEKTTVKHNKEIALLKGERIKAIAERDRLEAERVRHAEQMRRGEDLSLKLQQAEEAIGRSDDVITALAKELEQEERIQQRMALEDVYAQFEKEEALRETLAKMPADPAGARAELTAQEQRIADAITGRDALKAEAAAHARELRDLEAERRDVEGRRASGAALARKADLLLARVNEFSGDPSRRMKVSTTWNIPFAIGSAVVALAAIIAGVLVHPLCFAGLLALIGLWYARTTATVENSDAVQRIRTDVRDEFRNAGGSELRSENLQGLADELRAVSNAHDHVSEDLQRVSDALAKARDRAESVAGKMGLAESRIREEESQRSALLQRTGVSSKEDLVARMTERKGLTEEVARIDAGLRKHMATAGFSAKDAFRTDVRRRLADADRDGIPREGRPAADVQKQRKLLGAEQDKKRTLERSLGNMKEERGVSVGMARSMGSVLEDLLTKEKEIARFDEEIAGIVLNKQGAALAAEIFREMASDATGMLTALAAEMQSVFGGLVASRPTVAVETFNSETLRATDAGGVLRGIGHLSKGTRDTLTFAARLTLALKSDPAGEKRLLVLDEPFTSLDPARIANALAMVRRIQDDHGWQVVLFTKDRGLADAAMRALQAPVRYDLDVAQTPAAV